RGTAGTKVLCCEWLIDATGRAGSLAGRRARRLREDRLIAWVARFRPRPDATPDRDARTLIEAAEDGWWYSALLPGGERVVAFHTDPGSTDMGDLRTREGFSAHLRGAPHLCALLTAHGYEPLGRPRGADACSSRLDPVAGNRYLAVGDAALSFDPLSSQGLFNAFYTGLRGAEAVHASLSGRPRAIDGYEHRLRSVYAAYLTHRNHYYGREERWPGHPFWKRRQKARCSNRFE
ncbi:MAG: hypothetical protein MI919_36770, partial [Holophagales bacterium]|nr:hypothetical protein [Holophagales bacterium]